MSIFTSQFERVRPFSHAYTGTSGETGWRTPAAVVAAAGAGGLAVLGAAAVAGAGADADAGGDAWEAAWDSGWDADWAPGIDAGGADLATSGDWSHRGDYTDAAVGGDEGFSYFIDGDTSLTIG